MKVKKSGLSKAEKVLGIILSGFAILAIVFGFGKKIWKLDIDIAKLSNCCNKNEEKIDYLDEKTEPFLCIIKDPTGFIERMKEFEDDNRFQQEKLIKIEDTIEKINKEITVIRLDNRECNNELIAYLKKLIGILRQDR